MLTNKDKTPSIEEIAEMLRKLPQDKLSQILSLIDEGEKGDELESSSGICPRCAGTHIQKNAESGVPNGIIA